MKNDFRYRERFNHNFHKVGVSVALSEIMYHKLGKTRLLAKFYDFTEIVTLTPIGVYGE